MATKTKLVLSAVIASACATAQPPMTAPPPPVTTTGAVLGSPMSVSVVAPKKGPYRSEILGSKPELVEVEVTNSSDVERKVDPTQISFHAHRGAVPFRCDEPTDLGPRDPHVIAAHSSATFERELCTLPIPGHYTIDVVASFGAEPTAHVGSFAFDVTGDERNAPRALPSYPNLFAALGGNLTGVKFTKPEWKSGAYHVMLRVTNAATVDAPVGPATMLFHVYKDQRPLACTDEKPVDLPAKLVPGESAVVSIPVTCLVDVRGMYQIHAALSFPRDEGKETELAVIYVEVTSDPLIYLPIWPY